jgi:hypothetical protein
VQQPTGSRSAKISAGSPINSKRCGGQQELPNTGITRRHLLPPAPGYKLASYTVWSPTPDGGSSDGFPDEKKKICFPASHPTQLKMSFKTIFFKKLK